MFSSKSKDDSSPQNDPAAPLSIQNFTEELSGLLNRLLDASHKEKYTHNQLDYACKEFNYVINAFTKLKSFEADFSKQLKTLKAIVDDILRDLHEASTDSAKQQDIERNLKVVITNIKELKIQIPVQHQVIGPAITFSESLGYSQTGVTSKKVSDLPNPYEANAIFESGPFLKEFRDHYGGLCTSRKLRLLCFATFPENAEVKKRLLRLWWIGERLCPVPNQKNDLEVKCFCSDLKETLDEFTKMGFIEPVAKKGRLPATSYKMHPIIRSFIIKLAKEANFFDYDFKGNPTMAGKKSCLVEPKETSKLERVHELQTLFNISKQLLNFPVELFSKMRNIGVLHLGRWESTAERRIEVDNTKFFTGLENMKKLRFLGLRGIFGITKLPKSLCKLTNLRILDLRVCYDLEELPNGIGSLKKLIYLDLSQCYFLDKMPKQLSELSELKVLQGFVISKNSSCTLDNLAKLHKLEKLSIKVASGRFSINDNYFFKFKALKKLKIEWGAAAARWRRWNKVDNGAKATQNVEGEHEKQESGHKGGKLRKLGESSMSSNKKWEVENLRLKILIHLKLNWKELQTQFPKLKYLEKVKCPQITFCPCDANGVWNDVEA
ncbi:disease resistance RPP13-like protein 4 [Durio zibethinus]|uniref:Disease resistance RPP13-like protein 4 n=1 Tax=Durio zibethinus TaxID=66656 RepID=A0A6P6B4M3_DURZI|nr:disease resistance RPP13-like protein 4 [Durio zibethinus]